MRAVIKGALAAALLAGSSLAGTAPAEARDHTGVAIAAGILGLGIGAAIASSDHRDRYDNYYGYNAQVDYYAASPSYSYGYSYSRPYYGGYGYDRRYYRHHRDWNDRRWRDHDRHDRDRNWDDDGYRR
jgi:hypothetical protein